MSLPSPPGKTFVDEISLKGLCAGCGLCAAVAPLGAIEMHLSPQGWSRPLVKMPIDRESEQRIADVCPGAVVAHPETSQRDVLWGPLVAVRTGHATDESLRWSGSSGGVISALCLHLLETGAVSFIAQIAASAADPLRNELRLSRTREDVLRAAGSRYAPTAPLATMRELLQGQERFAVVAKPCDISALRRYARINPDVQRLVPYMLSFMCAGTPSQTGTDEILVRLGVEPTDVASFRYRGEGWPGQTTAVRKGGGAASMAYAESWGAILNRHLQFRCKICADGTGEFADVTGADAWYGKDGYPDFAEREGRSLILTRTAEGEKLVQGAAKAGAIVISPLERAEIEKMQPYQADRKRLVSARWLATWLVLGRAPRYRRLGLLKAAREVSWWRWLRHAAGTVRRIRNEV